MTGAAAAAVGRRLDSAPKDKLNVLFIAVDDLRPELGCYGHPMAKSPSIDALAEKGFLFERAYVQQAVCAPSRASLLTGTRPDTTGIYHLRTPVRKAMPNVLTLPQHFRNHGYETVSLGKIYHHWRDDNKKGWSTPAWHPRGPWTGRGYRSEAAVAAVKKRDATNPRKKGIGPATDDADVPDNGYRDGVVADEAVEHLRRLKGQGKPFFLAVGFYKPHLPFNAPKRYWDLYDRTKIELPDYRKNPQGAPGFALTNWGELRQYTDIPRKGDLDDAKSRQLIHGYYACVSYMDAQVGRVLDELERLGLADNTAIILWGDHGWKLGEYGDWCKHTNFEYDTHAPLLFHQPGQKNAGGRTDALVEFVDMYPSLCEACGLPVPEHLEGTSFLPLLETPDRPWKKAAFSQYPRGRMMGYTLRTDRWRYTEWLDRKSKKCRARELYDHQNDPGETRNLAAKPEHKDTVQRLSPLIKGGWKAALPPK
jgi:arylsulfatase A-like enzyme